MKLSGFTVLGLLKNTLGQSMGEHFHRTALALLTSDTAKRSLSVMPGSFADCVAYAIAPMAALAHEKIMRADGQRFAKEVYDLLPEQEEEHGIVPDPSSTIAQRKRVLEARSLLGTGSRRPALEDALRLLLGDNYVGIHVASHNETQLSPNNLGDSPMNLQPSNAPRKLIRITDWISINLGTEQSITYEALDPKPVGGVPILKVGDKLVIEPEIQGRMETVTVTEVGDDAAPPGASFSAVFNNAHEKRSLGTTMNFPAWMSTQREILVVVKKPVALDPVRRKQIHELLERMVTGVTAWDLVQESTLFHAGPFTTDDPVLGMLDANPLEEAAVP